MVNAKSPARQRRPKEETTRLGREIYERDIKAQVETDHHGEYIAVDVETGGWTMSDDVLVAAERLRAQRPDALDVYLLRVGYRALHHFGGRPWRRAE
jgi:hypothetical protein